MILRFIYSYLMVCSSVYSLVSVMLLNMMLLMFMLSVVVSLLWCDSLIELWVISMKFGFGIIVLRNSVVRMVSMVVDVVIEVFLVSDVVVLVFVCCF